MRFFSELKASVTQLPLYWAVAGQPLRRSVFFWLKFYLLLFASAVVVIVISAFFSKQLVERYYPASLVITYADSRLSTNGVSLPQRVGNENQAIIFLEDGVEIHSGGETVNSSYPDLFGPLPPTTVTKEDAVRFVPTLLPIMLIVFTTFFMMIFMGMRLFMLLLYTIIITSMISIFGKKMAYSAVLAMTLHAAVAAEVVNLLAIALYTITGVAMEIPLFDFAFFGIMLLVLRSRRGKIA